MMKKILLAFFVLISIVSSAQRLQKVNTYGYEYNRVAVDSLFALPADTFSVPAYYQSYPWVTRKGTTLYLWNTSAFVWEALTAGSSTDTTSLSNRINEKQNISDTNTVDATRYWVQQQRYADSLRRIGLAVQMRKNGNWTTQFNLPDSAGNSLVVGTIDAAGASTDGAIIRNDTLFMQLFGAEVPGLTPAGGDPAKADTSDMIMIDTTGVQDGYIATWDTTGTDKVVFAAPTGGSTDSTWHISFKTGVTTYAPAAGDSTFKHSYLVDKVMDVYREGIHQVYDDSVGYTYIVADTTIKFFPALDTNERIDIVLRDSTRQRWLALENNSINATEINYEGSSDVGNNGASSNILTTQYTVSPNENRILIVGIIGDVVNGADDITSVSYSGSSMTFSGKTISYQNRWQYLYYLMNPPSGAHNIVINSATVHYLGAGAIDYSGVAAIDSVKTSKTDYNATTHTSSITTEKNNSWVVCFEEGYSSAGPATAGAGLFRRNYQSGFNVWTLLDSNGPISPAGVYTITTNRPNDNGIGISHNIIVIKPY